MTRRLSSASGGMRLAALSAIALLAPASVGAAPLTLEDAVRLALERNERARIATEERAAAEARLARARTFFFPDLTATGSYTRQPGAYGDPALSGRARPEHIVGATATLQTTLFDARFFPLYRAAARSAEAAAFEAADARRLVAFEAADAYLLTLSAQQVSEAARRRQSLARRTREEAEVRFKAQLVSSNDVTRATLELAAADQAATRAAGDAMTAVLQLSYLLDSPVETPLSDPGEELPATAAAGDDRDALVRRALERRPDLLAAYKRAEAAEANAEEPLWRWLPTLGLTGRYGINQYSGADLPTTSSDDWSVSLGLTWFLFDGGERFAERSERLALSRIASLSREATARRVALDVRAALVSLEVADAAIRQAQVGVEVARKNAEETDVLYREGLARALEVADANVRLFEAEVTLARERYARALAWFDLRAALGQDPLGGETRP